MPRLHPLDPEHASATAARLLTEIIQRHGDAGPMVRTMAHSPTVLQGYLELSRAVKRAAVPRPLSEKISLALQEWLGCALCLEAHTAAGRSAGLSETDIALARQGTATDARDAALIGYALRVLTEPSTIGDDDLDVLRGYGWSDRVVADVVGLVALNQLTGAFNLVAGVEPAEQPDGPPS